MRVLPLVVALLFLATGCVVQQGDLRVMVREPNGVPDQTRGDEEYWMVWVHGNETRERIGVGGPVATVACSIAFDHALDVEARTLTVTPREGFDPEKVRAVVAFDHFERWSSCPITYEWHADPATLDRSLGPRYGNVTIRVMDNGWLDVNGNRTVPLGERLRISYEADVTDQGARYRVRGEVSIENLGAWERSLIAVE